jgi:transcriptional regulator GlxA family with amidase domain
MVRLRQCRMTAAAVLAKAAEQPMDAIAAQAGFSHSGRWSSY